MPSEAEMQAAEIKRLSMQLVQVGRESQQLQSGYFSVGNTFAAVTRELLLAMADPTEDTVEVAKKHARELLKHWDAGLEMKQKADEARAKSENNLIQLPPKELITSS